MSELYVVATPIGNLGDMTPRMSQCLSECDIIAAEDTRVTMKLLNALNIKKPLVSCHRHNEEQVAKELVDKMQAQDIKLCLTCDAGTPGISDPGSELVKLCIEAGIRVIPICGPSAVISHLSACGFGKTEFAFYGFLPREKKALSEKLSQIRRTGIPVAVFYESPHRVVDLVKAICAAMPGVRTSVACDISKLYEKIENGTCEEVLQKLLDNPNVEKGEYSVAIDMSGLEPIEKETPKSSCEGFILERMLMGDDMPAAYDAALLFGYSRNEAYRAKLRVSRFLETDE